MNSNRIGLAAGVTGYLLWGLYPLYWPLLKPASALEILAHRIFWSAVLVAGLLLAVGRFRTVLARMSSWRLLALLAGAALLMGINWGVYIWAVNSGNVVDTALGYFINPLMTIAAGVLLLGERLRIAERVALGLAATAVLVLLVGQREFPWIALALAGSFAGYSLFKKKAGLPAVESFATETAILALPAFAIVVALETTGSGTAVGYGWSHTALLVLTGVVSAAPLLCFGAAVVRLPFTTLGAIQYLAPVVQFLEGVLFYHEQMPLVRWLGFVLVWLAILVLLTNNLRRSPRAYSVTTPTGGQSQPTMQTPQGTRASGDGR